MAQPSIKGKKRKRGVVDVDALFSDSGSDSRRDGVNMDALFSDSSSSHRDNVNMDALLSDSDDDPMAVDMDALFFDSGSDDDAAEPAAKRQRGNDPVRKSIRVTLLPGAEFANGMLQVAPAVRALADQTSRKPKYVMPARADQNMTTLTAPAVRSLAALMADRGSWVEDDMTPDDTLRNAYAPILFERSHAIRLDPCATDAELQAANIVAATTSSQLARALHGPTALSTLSLEAPQLLSRPRKPRQQRSTRLVDAQLGPIHAIPSAPLPPNFPFVPVEQGKALTNKQKQQQVFHHEREESKVQYYLVHDPEPDPELPFGLPPLSYPATLAQENEKRTAFQQRHERLREASEMMPRVSIEPQSRAYSDRYRLPLSRFPAHEERTGCSCGEACVVVRLAIEVEGKAHWAYVLPSYLTPSEETEMQVAMAAGGVLRKQWRKKHPAGPCIECVTNNWTQRVLASQLSRKPPEHPMNMFSVAVGKGEYAREVMLPTVIEDVRTGIEHHVPVWDAAYRQFDPQPGDTAILREVNVDFHLSLSQINVCLGVRKARPLAGAHSTVTLPSASVLVFRDPRAPEVVATESAASLLWTRYVRTLPVPLLADRALTSQPPPDNMSRVPVVCLRHCLFSPTTLTFTPAILSILTRSNSAAMEDMVVRLFNAADAPTLLAALAAVALVPFEHTVAFLLTQPVDAPLVNVPVQLLLAPDTLVSDVSSVGRWLLGVFSPHGDKLTRPPPDNGWTPARCCARTNTLASSWVIYTACIWRISVALLLQALLRQWPTVKEQETFRDWIQYFIDTHLDLLSLFGALAPACDDRWFLSYDDTSEPRLTHLYPQCTRVVCADELPGLTPRLFATNLWCDLPRKKQHTSMELMLEHIYLKTRNSICLIRGSDNIIEHGMASYVAIQRLIMLVLRCGWLGNFPHSHGRPALPARLRINAAFAPRYAFFPHVTEAQEAAHDKEVRAWVKEHPMLTLAMLREHYLYMAESSYVIDQVFGQSRHWHYFKSVVRMGNTQLRRAVNASVAESGAAVDWAIVEERINKKTSHGEVMKWHDKEKDHNIKLFKDTSYGIMLRKMTQVEEKENEKLHIHVTFDNAAVLEWAQVEGRMATIQLFAWTIANLTQMPLADGTMRAAVLTGMLKCCGMSETNYRLLRAWMHSFDEYHTSDNSFVDFATYMYQRDWRDYVLWKLVLRLVERYSSEFIGFTSIEHYRAQLLALRNNMALPAFVETTPRLGYAHYCEGCCKWAHPMARPSREYLGMPIQGDRARQRNRRRALLPLPPAPSKHAPQRQQTKKKKDKPQRPFAPRAKYLGDGRAVCMQGVAFNPLDGGHYCLRGANKATPDDEEGDDEEEEDSSMSSSSSSEEEEEVSEESEPRRKKTVVAAEVGVAGSAGGGGRSKKTKPDIARLLLTHFSCKNPAVAVDLPGINKDLLHHVYTQCAYCANKCEVIAANVTNDGQSCGEHALVNEYPRWHPIWRHIQRPADKPTVPVERSCYKCGLYDTVRTTTLWVYDARYRLATLTLCRYHTASVKTLIPRQYYNEQTAPVSFYGIRDRLARVD